MDYREKGSGHRNRRDSESYGNNYYNERSRDNSHNKRPRGGENRYQHEMDNVQEPGDRYILEKTIGIGSFGKIYSAADCQAGKKKVCIKIQKFFPEIQRLIIEEYKVLRDLSGHPNIPDFYGIFCKRAIEEHQTDEVWFVTELCEGGPVMDVVRQLVASEKKMEEEHLAYILSKIIAALIFLHENNVIHRNIRGDNILLTKNGEVKLGEFGFAKQINENERKKQTIIGSPDWMAPEVIMANRNPDEKYDIRADVWSIGITAIELAEGKSPFHDMHPTRVLFQIIRNPPPKLRRQTHWSPNYNDFVAECLEKTPENRPISAEIVAHPLIESVPEQDYHLTQEIKSLVMRTRGSIDPSANDKTMIYNNFVKVKNRFDVMLTEDLSTLDIVTEDKILSELHKRFTQGDFQTYMGEILIILNPNENQDVYGHQFHEKYCSKSTSENSPHIYSLADKAFQDVFHTGESQIIILTGESSSGKTTNSGHLIQHLLYLGKSLSLLGDKFNQALNIFYALSHAPTLLNENSTRCVFQMNIKYASMGKVSGATFNVYQLEKWRVSYEDRNQGNFNIFYYMYDGLKSQKKLNDYGLSLVPSFRYLRMNERPHFKVYKNSQFNYLKFHEISEAFDQMDLHDVTNLLWSTLSSILILGEIRFNGGYEDEVTVENIDVVKMVARKLEIDFEKFNWCLTNYCIIRKGQVFHNKHTYDETIFARDVLANTLYHRLFDWIIHKINQTLLMPNRSASDKHMVSVLDYFGFECFGSNSIEQLIINTTNEQIQFYYNQHAFSRGMQDCRDEEIEINELHFYDNHAVLEELMEKDYGLFYVIDDASLQCQNSDGLLENIQRKTSGSSVKIRNANQFSVTHYTGLVSYDVENMIEKNRDFLPPEMINTLRQSAKPEIKEMFTFALSKTGNLICSNKAITKDMKMIDNSFSQTRRMRTCASTFRATSLEILRKLSEYSNNRIHFVKCIRTGLEGKAWEFNHELVKQQIQALAIVNSTKMIQQGYSHRITFNEFIERYKFLAFDFDENVPITSENCRLLLIRLKMEGWAIGKTKVFLKHYNVEYLSRLYETQVRCIIKVQSLMRAFISRKKLKLVIKKSSEIVRKQKNLKPSISEDEAAVKIQKCYRGHMVRKESKLGSKDDKHNIGDGKKSIIYRYAKKWRSKSLFQLLLHYRAVRHQDLINLSQQVHLFNEASLKAIQKDKPVDLNNIIQNIKAQSFLEFRPISVHKLPFNFENELGNQGNKQSQLNYHSNLELRTTSNFFLNDETEGWDNPIVRRSQHRRSNIVKTKDATVQTNDSHSFATQTKEELPILKTPYSRYRDDRSNKPHQRETLFQSPSIDYQDENYPGSWNSSQNYKKMAAPKSPILQDNISAKNTRVDSYSMNHRPSNKNSTEYNKPADINFQSKRANPIDELRVIGKKHNNDFDSEADQPPFNFQAMLRRTDHHRRSMNRTEVFKSVSQPPLNTFSNNDEFYSNENIVNKNKRRVDESKPINMYSSERNSIGNKPFSEKIDNDKYRNEKMIHNISSAKRVNSFDNKSKMVRNPSVIDEDVNYARSNDINKNCEVVQVAPGVVIEGYCADL